MDTFYCASQGLGQAEIDCMNFLENDIIGIKDIFVPLQSSSTQSSKTESKGATDDGGRPPKDMEDLTESGEQNQEDA